MGYTHYFTQLENLTDEEWTGFTDEVRKIVSEYEGNIEVTIDSNHVRIDDGYWESFIITKDMKTEQWHPNIPSGFGFTKTGGADYDKAITASLIALHNNAGNKFRINSDGSYEFDWVDGVALYTMATGKDAVNPISADEEVDA